MPTPRLQIQEDGRPNCRLRLWYGRQIACEGTLDGCEEDVQLIQMGSPAQLGKTMAFVGFQVGGQRWAGEQGSLDHSPGHALPHACVIDMRAAVRAPGPGGSACARAQQPGSAWHSYHAVEMGATLLERCKGPGWSRIVFCSISTIPPGRQLLERLHAAHACQGRLSGAHESGGIGGDGTLWGWQGLRGVTAHGKCGMQKRKNA